MRTDIQKARSKWMNLIKHTKITPKMVKNFNQECNKLYYGNSTL